MVSGVPGLRYELVTASLASFIFIAIACCASGVVAACISFWRICISLCVLLMLATDPKRMMAVMVEITTIAILTYRIFCHLLVPVSFRSCDLLMIRCWEKKYVAARLMIALIINPKIPARLKSELMIPTTIPIPIPQRINCCLLILPSELIYICLRSIVRLFDKIKYIENATGIWIRKKNANRETGLFVCAFRVLSIDMCRCGKIVRPSRSV